jgi:hypothetical protein
MAGLSLTNTDTPAIAAGVNNVNSIKTKAINTTPDAAAAAHDFVTANPGASAGLTTAVSKLPGVNPTMPALSQIAQMDQQSSSAAAAKTALTTPQVQAANHSFFMKLWGVAKEASRDTIAVTQLPWEALQASIRQDIGNWKKSDNPSLFDILKKKNPMDVLRQTTLGQDLIQGFNKTGSNLDPMGNGIFPGGTVAAKARAEGAKNWSINGEPASPGNVLANGIGLDPQSTTYKVTTALTDLIAQLKLDPTILAGKVIKEGKVVEEAGKTKEVLTAAKNVQADASRVSTLNQINQLKSELDAFGDNVLKAKATSAKGVAEGAAATVTAPSKLVHATDPEILDLTNKIAQAKDARNGIAQIKDAIQANHDEFQKTIAKDDSTVNPYADRLQQTKDSLSAFDTTIKELNKQIAPLEDSRRKASAVLARAMDSHAEDLVAKSQAKLEGIAGQQSVLKNRLSAALDNLAGIASDPRGIEVDYNKVADLVSGRYGEPLVQHLINSKNPIDIWRDLKKSIPIEAAVALSKSQTREDVLSALAPLIGGKIEGGLPLTAAAKITANADGVVHHMLPNWVKDTVVKSGDKIQSLTSFVPKGSVYHLDDTNALVHAVENYGRYMKLPKDTIDGLLNKIITAESNSTKGIVASKELFNAIFDNYEGGLNKFQKDALFESTRIFDGGKTGMQAYWASRHAAGAHLDFIVNGGKKVTLKGPHLESELLNSTIFLPSPDEMKKIVSMLSKTKSMAAARAVAKSGMEMWRTSKLLRPAYMVRNLMEMQVRQYLQGSPSFIQSPMASLAMIAGKSNGSAWRKMLSQMEQYSGDALGYKWADAATPEEDAVINKAMEEYQNILSSNIGSADSRMGHVAALQGFAPIEFGHPKFFTGHAFELKKLSGDSVAKILSGKVTPEIKADIKSGKSFEDAVTDYFFKGSGKSVMDKLAASRPDSKTLFNTREGIKQYIFDAENGVQARLDEMTGGIPALYNLVQNGSAMLNSGKVIRLSSDPLEQRQLAADLKRAFSNSQELKGVKVNVRLSDAAREMDNSFATKGTQYVSDAVDAWFRTNNKFEKVISMGPEYRVEYWRQMAKFAPSLDAKSLETLQNNIDKSLLGIRVDGKAIGKNNPTYKTIMDAPGNGPISLDVAHGWAADKAADHVKGMFYDAYNHRNIFHATRFAIPFGQAWWDTLERWGQLGKENPLQTYKAAVLLNKLENDPNTSAVYSAFGVTGYDPNQGFIQQDPLTNAKKVYIPILGTVLSALTQASTGVKTEGTPFQIATNPMGLNFALGGGSLAPGVGPMISLPAQTIIPSNWWNGLPPAVQGLIFPFGKPQDVAAGISSSLLPTWAAKLTNLFSNGTASQATTVSTLRPVMDYLASGGGYNIMDPNDQQRLINDSTKFARYFGAWQGITQAILPTSPLLSALAKSGDSTVVAQASIYAHFQNLLNTTDKGDYYKAVRDTLDTYGVNNIYALITNTKGGTPPTTDAYNFLAKNPDVADKYKDVFTLFFPGGGFSQALYQQQVRSGQRVKLTADQVEQQANYLLYMAAKDQIDVNNSDDPVAHQDAMDNLKQTFGGSVPARVIAGAAGRYANPAQYMINQVTQAVKNPKLAETPAGQAAIDYLYLRSQALQEAADSGLKTLSGNAMADTRQALRDAAAEIDKHYNGEFAIMFQSVFESEVRN